jgi:hypothetical protein
MGIESSPEMSLYLVSGLLLASSGLFIALRAGGTRGMMAGLLLISGGANTLILTLTRLTAATRSGDIMAFLVIILVLCMAIVFAAAWPARTGEGSTGGGSDDGRG